MSFFPPCLSRSLFVFCCCSFEKKREKNSPRLPLFNKNNLKKNDRRAAGCVAYGSDVRSLKSLAARVLGEIDDDDEAEETESDDEDEDDAAA